MGRIPEETIEAVRDRTDIVDLVGRYVTLRQVGRSFKGLCPFHSEKTPSFQVNPERQIFHCFGCGEGGNAFGFLMRHENLTFPEAVRQLARECGVEVPETAREDSGLDRLREANELAQRLFVRELAGPAGAGARAYLERRGFDAAAARRFGVGLAPDRWDGVVEALRAAGIPAAVGERAGLLAPRRSGSGHYDRLRGRVTFPIRDARGRLVGFGGRALAADQEPKYLNTPETPIFRKREVFYGLPEALEPMRRRGRAVISEGYFDRIALARAGVEEALATCGTALTPEHARQLLRRTREVVLLFDGDAAGQRAAERSLEVLLPEGLRVRAAALPPGQDPDDLLRAEGPEALARRVDEAAPALQWVIRRAVAEGCRTPWEKADAVAAVAKLLARVADPVERGEYVRELAFRADVRPEAVEAALRRERAGAGGSHPEIDGTDGVLPSGARRRGPESRAARELARLLIQHPARARDCDPEELRGLVPADDPWAAALPAWVEACRRAERPDPSALVADLGPEASAALLEAAVEDGPLREPDEAERAISDTIAWLRRRRHVAERRATTRRFREDPAADAAALLAEKQRQLEQKRVTQGRPPDPRRTQSH